MRLFMTTCAAMALSAGASFAAPINFYMSSDGLRNGSVDYSSGGVNMTVSGFSCADGAGPNDAGSCTDELVDVWYRGLGIDTDSGSAWWYTGDSHQVDGYMRDEFVEVVFDQEVALDSAMFSYYNDEDEFRVFTHNGSSWDDEGEFDACVSGCSQSNTALRNYAFGSSITATRFLFAATEDDDAWKFYKLSVTVPAGQETVVPLPAAGWLLIGALGGLAAMRRRSA